MAGISMKLTMKSSENLRNGVTNVDLVRVVALEYKHPKNMGYAMEGFNGKIWMGKNLWFLVKMFP